MGGHRLPNVQPYFIHKATICFYICKWHQEGQTSREVVMEGCRSGHHYQGGPGLTTYQNHLSNFLFLFRAAPVAYESSQSRGWIRATASSLCHSHSNAGSKLHLWPRPQLMAMELLNPLSQGWNLHPQGTITFLTHWATMGTPGHS